MGYDWDPPVVDEAIKAVVEEVRRHITLPFLTITIVPAAPFPWFRDLPRARWTNAFTNGPGNVVVAIPPEPDLHYLASQIAHECHHACPENPIYDLALEQFTLAEWLKMEGAAEYFANLLYPDDRWWWPAFPVAQEPEYWGLIQPHLESTDDGIKVPLAFGSKEKGIPTFAGYTFGYRAVAHYLSRSPGTTIRQLYRVSPRVLVETYARSEENWLHEPMKSRP